MSSQSFGLDTESVRRHHFPHSDAWSSASRPSLSTVEEAIEEEAAELAGALLLQEIDAAAIAPSTGAYNSCRKVLRVQVAARIARDMTGADPALVQAWKRDIAYFYEQLRKFGDTFLGDGAASSGESEPDGPTWHGTGLEQDTKANMSSTIPLVRKDDAL